MSFEEFAHARGECKPCASFWRKADGCRKGIDCPFCHICNQGSVKKKRKALKKELKIDNFLDDMSF